MRVVGIGAGGHAKVLLDILLTDPRVRVIGVTDSDPALRGQSVLGIPVLGGDDILASLRSQGVEGAFIGVGSVGPALRCQQLFEDMQHRGFHILSITHPRAVVARDVQRATGVMVMAGAVVNPGVHLGCNVIINTGAIVEHDTWIGDHVHVAPGAVIGGGVVVEAGAHIGLGARIRQGIRIGAHALVASGAVVVRDVAAHTQVMGVPARPRDWSRGEESRHD